MLFCGVTVVLLAGSTIVLNALVSRFSAKINLRVGNELRAEVFGMFLNTDWESLQQFHSGDLLSASTRTSRMWRAACLAGSRPLSCV